jgi:hypothetical protein
MIDVISGGLTVLTILMGVLVLVHWIKPAATALKSRRKISSEQWLIIGVVVAFTGQTLDNSYWLVTWTANYFDSESILTHWLFDNGMVANLPFRQACGIVAAYCHVYAAVMIDEIKTQKFKTLVLISSIAGVIFSLGMVFFKY